CVAVTQSGADCWMTRHEGQLSRAHSDEMYFRATAFLRDLLREPLPRASRRLVRRHLAEALAAWANHAAPHRPLTPARPLDAAPPAVRGPAARPVRPDAPPGVYSQQIAAALPLTA